MCVTGVLLIKEAEFFMLSLKLCIIFSIMFDVFPNSLQERNETIKQLKEEINALKSDADHYKMKEDQWFKEKNDLENQLNKLNQADHSDAEQQVI